MFTPEQITVLLRILGALAVGSIIGFERSYHGRPAGLRTHALVCTASLALMLVTVLPNEGLINVSEATIRTDPTRMAQGIMTGIGFRGAGVIYKEGLTVRGLATSALIWMTAAVGILIGSGFHLAAVFTTIASISILSLFHRIERALINKRGFTVANFSSRLIDNGHIVEYRMVMRSRDRAHADELSIALRDMPNVKEFRITPTGN
jgi:putative Mg2+ transporter-C (MgtC) family protein